ncbi:hypothetical protein COY27_00025 [Candidatus Woesearchaeota archaeon CG_4_10_14_0_2_um_filter_33_13]|nr:MAG: hypothetical protein COY27_00025 [Candidatus Woesearchaeota archaeon CG_4_10_14_0_2_um_filter_33_13]
MINSIKTAFDQGKPILNPDYLSEISEDDLEQILEGNTTIPLFERRLTILRELGGSIKDYTKFIYKCNFDALKFVDCLVLRMPSFKDESEYNGEIITFNKRAQLLSSDLGYLLGFSNMNRLTACADYILPMVLRFNHVFEYSPKLENIITNGKELPSGSKEEVEIRANTIWAVELMSRISGKTSMEINDYLWLAGNFIPETQSYHLTRTTAY